MRKWIENIKRMVGQIAAKMEDYNYGRVNFA